MIRGEKYSRRRCLRELRENVSHANLSWFTVYEIFYVIIAKLQIDFFFGDNRWIDNSLAYSYIQTIL